MKLVPMLFVGILMFGSFGVAGEPQVRRSAKRGICYNGMSLQDAEALAPGVSWAYNWHYRADDFLLQEGAPIDFYPMVWGADEKKLNGLRELLESGFKPKYVLAINEPNLKDQAFITPEENATWHRKIEELAGKYDIKTIGPHMALGSAEKASITAFDPIEEKDTTYTYMVPYLNAFFYFLGGVDEVHAVAVHSYGDIRELTWMIDMLDKTYGKPIWVTEFSWWGAKNEDEQIDYMIQAIDLFERHPSVEKYAWFMLRIPRHKRMAIMSDGEGALTSLGEMYVNMPAYDPAYFAPIPGKLDTAGYIRMGDANLRRSRDEGAHIDVGIAARDSMQGWLEYQIDVSEAGTYEVICRAARGGTLALRKSDVELGTVKVEDDFSDARFQVDLPAGRQSLIFAAAEGGVWLNQITFRRVE